MNTLKNIKYILKINDVTHGDNSISMYIEEHWALDGESLFLECQVLVFPYVSLIVFEMWQVTEIWIASLHEQFLWSP